MMKSVLVFAIFLNIANLAFGKIYIGLERVAYDFLESLPNINKYRAEPPLGHSHEAIVKKFEEIYGSSAPADLGPQTFRPNVTIPEFGTARGIVMKTLGEKDIYSFLSIPYATVPERFKMAEEFEGPWEQDLGDRKEFDATYYKTKCPQGSYVLPIVSGREDCLRLSIYTRPGFTDTSKYPVLYFIHGGAYTSGDASLYVPTKLMDQEGFIVVTVQYRLGTLGFITTGTSDAPGNMGLMDQVLGLRWVQKYISYFGGDPDQVTIMGQSAGAASVSLLQMTDQTKVSNSNNKNKDLFHRIIEMSGSSIDMWTLDTDPEGSFIAQANATGCCTTENECSLECMKTKTLNELYLGDSYFVQQDRLHGGLGFGGNCPVVQNKNLPPELIFMDKHPLIIVQEGDALPVDMIAGNVRDEGSFIIGYMYNQILVPNGVLDDPYFLSVEMMPWMVNAFGIVDLTGVVANTMYLEFLNNTDTTNFTSMSGGLVDMGGVMFLKSGLWSLCSVLKTFNPTSKIFFYSFEFESDDSLFPWIFYGRTNFPIEGGIAHADDLLYLFYLPAYLGTQREKEQAKRSSLLFGNFIKYGNPTPDSVNSSADEWVGETEKWKPFHPLTLDYLLIQDELTMQNDIKLRWNYNTAPYVEPSDPQVKETLDEHLERSSDGGTKDENGSNGYKIATGLLSVACVGLLIFSIGLIWRR